VPLGFRVDLLVRSVCCAKDQYPRVVTRRQAIPKAVIKLAVGTHRRKAATHVMNSAFIMPVTSWSPADRSRNSESISSMKIYHELCLEDLPLVKLTMLG
jgi:hypothetical protein